MAKVENQKKVRFIAGCISKDTYLITSDNVSNNYERKLWISKAIRKWRIKVNKINKIISVTVNNLNSEIITVPM